MWQQAVLIARQTDKRTCRMMAGVVQFLWVGTRFVAVSRPGASISAEAASVPASAMKQVVAKYNDVVTACNALAKAERDEVSARYGYGASLEDRRTQGKKKKKKGMIDTEPVTGTRDFPPEAMRLRTWLFNTWRDIATQFSFAEYDAPVLEAEALYIRKAGEEIVDQMYNFVDKEEHRVALRPEMTPSLARLVLGKGKALKLPAKWFSIPQCWRFEHVQRGRRREHFQWNCDIIGVKGVGAEAELLAAITTFFQSVGLSSKLVSIRVSSRTVLQSILKDLKVPDDMFASVCVIVDKLDKMEAPEVLELLVAAGVKQATGQKIIDALNPSNTMDDLEASLGADNPAVVELRELFSLAKAYGYDDYLQYDPSVVRGLAYYTGIVFEAFDRKREFRAITGGGRYDKLMTTFGAPQPIPACGFGFGDCVIVELLKAHKLMPSLPDVVDYCVVPMSESLRPAAARVLTQLRKAGKRADIIMDKKKKLGWSLGYADTIGASRTVLLMEDEWADGEKVIVKHMTLAHDADPDAKQVIVTIADLLQGKDELPKRK